MSSINIYLQVFVQINIQKNINSNNFSWFQENLPTTDSLKLLVSNKWISRNYQLILNATHTTQQKTEFMQQYGHP